MLIDTMDRSVRALFILHNDEKIITIDREWDSETLFKNILEEFSIRYVYWKQVNLELKKYPFNITKTKHIKDGDEIFIDFDLKLTDASTQTPVLRRYNASVQTSVLHQQDAFAQTSVLHNAFTPVSHTASEKESKKDYSKRVEKYKTRMCDRFSIGICPRGKSCTYAHNRIEVLYFNWNPNFDKISYCSYYVPFIQGSCGMGTNCKYLHSYEEYVGFQNMVNYHQYGF